MRAIANPLSPSFEALMHPKTFNILLRRPLGLATQLPYVFYLHAESAREALDEVARLFDGVDIAPTLHRWANPSTQSRVGNADPVVVIDCDSFRNRARVGGRFVERETVPGQYRRSPEEVTADLLKIFKNLQEEHLRLVDSFAGLKRAYERHPVAWYLKRLEELKQAADNALRWQANLWPEYLARARSQVQALTLPQAALPTPDGVEAAVAA